MHLHTGFTFQTCSPGCNHWDLWFSSTGPCSVNYTIAPPADPIEFIVSVYSFLSLMKPEILPAFLCYHVVKQVSPLFHIQYMFLYWDWFFSCESGCKTLYGTKQETGLNLKVILFIFPCNIWWQLKETLSLLFCVRQVKDDGISLPQKF